MCIYCTATAEERKNAIAHAERLTNQFKILAEYELDLAYGRKQPHADTGHARQIAHAIVRALVDEYI